MRKYDLQGQKINRHIGEETPSYRAYGVKRRVRPLTEKLMTYLLRGLVIFVLGIFGLFILLGMGSLLAFTKELLVKLIVWILLAGVIAFFSTRTIRKRLKFTRKLKKLCKKHGFSLKYEQNFFQSLVWSPDRQDFVLKTKDRIYYVRYLTIRKYRSTLFLEKEDELRLVKYPLKNVITVVFDRQPKVKTYPLKFQVPAPLFDMPTVKALVINPVCQDIKYKHPNGGYETTGSGGAHFGFTVYTGSGFLEALTRDNAGRKENR